jgi:hypothetical protein
MKIISITLQAKEDTGASKARAVHRGHGHF